MSSSFDEFSLIHVSRHCEEGVLPDEAISLNVLGIASGKEQERPRNDGIISYARSPLNCVSYN